MYMIGICNLRFKNEKIRSKNKHYLQKNLKLKLESYHIRVYRKQCANKDKSHSYEN